MKKLPEVTAQTRRNLLAAFWVLYTEKRIDRITIREITQKAGYNRGTFYEYFTDVYDVLAQMEDSLVPTASELPPFSLPNVNMGMPLNLFMSLYEENSKYYAVLLGENGDPAFAGKLKNAAKPAIRQAFSDNLRISDMEFDFVLEYILSAMIGVMSHWFRLGKPLSSEKLYELIRGITEDGVKMMFHNEP